MKVAVAIDKYGTISRHMGTCRGFLVFNEVEGVPVVEEVRLNPLGGLNFGPATSEFPRLNKGLKQYIGSSLAFSISRILGDCNALLCRGAGPIVTRRLKEKGLRIILTRIQDPQKALGTYWREIKHQAA